MTSSGAKIHREIVQNTHEDSDRTCETHQNHRLSTQKGPNDGGNTLTEKSLHSSDISMEIFVNQDSEDESGSELGDEDEESKTTDSTAIYVFKIVFTVYPSSKSDQ